MDCNPTICSEKSIMLRSGKWTLVILNKGKTMIWEVIEIYSQEKSIYNRDTISRQ